MTAHRTAATALVLRHSFLTWVELQLLSMQTSEIDAWTEILSNVVFVVDHAKCDQATLGAWRVPLVTSLTCISSLGALRVLCCLVLGLMTSSSFQNYR